MGWSANVVLYPIKKLKPDEVVIFYGIGDKDAEESVEEAMEKIRKESPIPPKFIEVDPFSLEDCIEKIRPELTEDGVANITGGTKIMSFALALLATYGDRTNGEIPVIYVVTKEGKYDIKRIALAIDEMDMGLKKNKKKNKNVMKLILEVLKNQNDELPAETIKEEIERITGRKISPSGFSEAKSKLVCRNLIFERKEKNRGYYSLKSGAWFFLEGEENE